MFAEDYGVREVLRAADKVSCRCGTDGCVLAKLTPEELVSSQADPIPVRWTEPKPD